MKFIKYKKNTPAIWTSTPNLAQLAQSSLCLLGNDFSNKRNPHQKNKIEGTLPLLIKGAQKPKTIITNANIVLLLQINSYTRNTLACN